MQGHVHSLVDEDATRNADFVDKNTGSGPLPSCPSPAQLTFAGFSRTAFLFSPDGQLPWLKGPSQQEAQEMKKSGLTPSMYIFLMREGTKKDY
jgi:hypothetical protein